jgi:ELWxxDGT repeat protein
MHLPSCLILGALLSAGLGAQTPYTAQLAADVNPQVSFASSSPSGSIYGPGNRWFPGLMQSGGLWFFTASTTATGSELWATDGTAAGTRLVKDIRPGTSSSSIANIAAGKVGSTDVIFFEANDGVNGTELWISDGTSAGTVLVKDIRAGSLSSDIDDIVFWNGKAFFEGDDGNGNELFVSDGTAAGTFMLKDINTTSATASSNPGGFQPIPGTNLIVFQANDGSSGVEPWVTDGTAAGTIRLADINSGSSSGLSTSVDFFPFNGKIYFEGDDGIVGDELWVTDGTPAGTMLLKDINSGPSNSDPALNFAVEFGGKFYFEADDGTHGDELWVSDGTAAGTMMVADLNSGTANADPTAMTVVGSTMFLRADDGINGDELWTYDTTNGLQLVKDIRSGLSASSPYNLTPLGSGVVFTANDGTSGTETYYSDGTSAGTVQLGDLNAGSDSSSGSWFTALSSTQVLFAATSSSNGRELFVTGGTPASTQLLLDINPAVSPSSSDVQNIHVAGGERVYFSAFISGVTGRELYSWSRTDGLKLIKDIYPGSSSSSPNSFHTLWNGQKWITFFEATDGTNGSELWVTDGTSAGTMLVKDINGTSGSTSINDQFVALGKLWFTANDGSNGTEVWTSDGTSAGTMMLKDIYPGSSSSNADYFVELGGKVYFEASDGSGGSGSEIWVSDGTSAGTQVFVDIRAGGTGSSPTYLTRSGDKFFFRANDGTNGTELWVSDGTVAGTQMVLDIAASSASSSPFNLTAGAPGTIFFEADDGTTGDEPWISDGTAAGTIQLADIRSGTGNSDPGQFTWADGRMFFEASDSTNGQELWVSDGTVAGTMFVKDINSGTSGASIDDMVAVGQRVFFEAFDGTESEIWVSDGTTAGTVIAADPTGPGVSTSPDYLAVAWGQLVFDGRDAANGAELFRIRRPGASAVSFGNPVGPDMPRVEIGTPLLGTAVPVSGMGFANGFGVVFLGVPTFNAIAVPGGGPLALDVIGLQVLGTVTTPTWSANFNLPNNQSLEGVRASLQVIWGQQREHSPAADQQRAAPDHRSVEPSGAGLRNPGAPRPGLAERSRSGREVERLAVGRCAEGAAVQDQGGEVDREAVEARGHAGKRDRARGVARSVQVADQPGDDREQDQRRAIDVERQREAAQR